MASALMLSAGSAFGQTNIFVDASAPGPLNDGVNWSRAYLTLDEALDEVNTATSIPSGGFQILVAEGIYKPITSASYSANVIPGGSASTPWHHTFYVERPCEIYGGFKGSSASGTPSEDPDNPDGIGYFTILSGDIGVSQLADDNCAHVLFAGDMIDDTLWESKNLVLQNLRIVDGNARDDSSAPNWMHRHGGGIYAHRAVIEFRKQVFVETCRAQGNGGGVYIEPEVVTTEPTLRGSGAFRSALSRLDRNLAFGNGGAVYIGSSEYREPRATKDGQTAVYNTVFRDNVAIGNGGGIYSDGDFRNDTEDGGFMNPGFTVANSLFYGNYGNQGGGAYIASGLHTDASDPASEGRWSTYWINNTFAVNRAGTVGGGIALDATPNVKLYNNIVFFNTVTSAMIECNLYFPDPTFGNAPLLLNLSHSDIGESSNSIDWYLVAANPPTGVFVSDIIRSDPKFVNASQRDFRLQNTSPCLDVGRDSFLPFDQMNIDEDNPPVVAETLPLDFTRINVNGVLENWRELKLPGGPNPPILGSITGDDTGGARPNAITDLGCYEVNMIDVYIPN